MFYVFPVNVVVDAILGSTRRPSDPQATQRDSQGPPDDPKWAQVAAKRLQVLSKRAQVTPKCPQLGQPSVPGGDQKRCEVDLASVFVFVPKNGPQCRLTKRFNPGCEAFRWGGSKEGSTPGFPPWPFCLPRSGRLGVPMPSVSLNLRSLCAGFA